MLDVLNRYGHGFVAIPTILACRDAGLFEALAGGPQTDLALEEGQHANSCYLQA